MLVRAFTRALRHWRALIGVSLATSVPASVLVGIAMRYLLDGVVVVDGEVIGWRSTRIAPTAVIVAVAAVIGVFGYLAIVWLMMRAVDDDGGADPRRVEHGDTTTASELARARQAFAHAGRAAGRAAGWMVLAAVIVAGVVAIFAAVAVAIPALGVLLALVLAPLGAWLGVRYAFFAQAIVDRPGNPYARSAIVVTGRWWPTLGRLLVVGIVTGVIGFMANSATSAASGNGWGGGFGDETPVVRSPDGTIERLDVEALAPSASEIALGVIGTLVGAVFTSGVGGAAFADMYRTRRPADETAV